MDLSVLSFVFVLGIVYGLITLLLELKEEQKEKFQISLSVVIMIISGLALWMLE